LASMQTGHPSQREARHRLDTRVWRQRSHGHPHPADTVGNAAAEHGEPAKGITDGRVVRSWSRSGEARGRRPCWRSPDSARRLVVTETVARASGEISGVVTRRRGRRPPRLGRYPGVGSSAVTEDNLALDARG
jgi:hypothetical protein